MIYSPGGGFGYNSQDAGISHLNFVNNYYKVGNSVDPTNVYPFAFNSDTSDIRMLEMQPTRPIHYYNRGDSYRRLAMDAAAKRDFKKFLGNTALPPENPKVKSAFAFTYRK